MRTSRDNARKRMFDSQAVEGTDKLDSDGHGQSELEIQREMPTVSMSEMLIKFRIFGYSRAHFGGGRRLFFNAIFDFLIYRNQKAQYLTSCAKTIKNVGIWKKSMPTGDTELHTRSLKFKYGLIVARSKTHSELSCLFS